MYPSGSCLLRSECGVEKCADPGIGPAYSKKIIDNWPYNGKNDILAKAGVPQAK